MNAGGVLAQGSSEADLLHHKPSGYERFTISGHSLVFKPGNNTNINSPYLFSDSNVNSTEFEWEDSLAFCSRDISQENYLDVNREPFQRYVRTVCSEIDDQESENTARVSVSFQPSLFIRVDNHTDGNTYLVVISVDQQGKVHVYHHYVGNSFHHEWIQEERWLTSDESGVGHLWRISKEKEEIRLSSMSLQDDVLSRLSFPEPGTFEIIWRNSELVIVDHSGLPRIIELPLLKRSGLTFLFGYRYVPANTAVAKLSKKGADCRSVVTTDYSARSEFDRFSRLAEIMNKLVRLFHLRHQFQGFYEDSEQQEAVKKNLQKINMLAGRTISLLLPNKALYTRLDDLLGTGAPVYRNASLEISADNLVFSLMDYYQDDHWPEFMMLFFAMADMGVEGLDAEKIDVTFREQMQIHDFWRYVVDENGMLRPNLQHLTRDQLLLGPGQPRDDEDDDEPVLDISEGNGVNEAPSEATLPAQPKEVPVDRLIDI